MKPLIFILTALTAFGLPCHIHAQAQELEMLALDMQKLSQMKQTLQNMYNAYSVLENGYNKVKDVTSGNYSLHQAFLDGLLAVSPSVKNYVHVSDIISDETEILSGYKTAFARIRSCNLFSVPEIKYVGGVYTKIVEGSLKNIDALIMVLTAGQTRMGNGERLTEIDRIYLDMQARLASLRNFNKMANGIMVQRKALRSDHVIQKNITGAHE